VVLDDGFQIAEGDWDTNPDKFPKGNKGIKNLVDKIHDQGLKAKIWWAPLAADPQSKLLIENPDMLVIQKNGAPQFITWWDAYYLSPSKEKTIAHTKETIRMFMEEWGFDGLKMDGQHMNGVGLDYSLDNPKTAPESLPGFFKMIYDEARSIKPNAVVENCPCGACMSFFNMAHMNQAVSSDPLSSWQVRHKGKTYKALIPKTAYYGDHVELSDNANDFASSFGVGAVLGTKFTWPKDNPYASESFLLTPEKEILWKKWFSLYNEKMLSKENYLGSLYDIGYDKPETHVIKKENTMYYSFYAENWDGKIEFRGLDKNISYLVKDYFNNKDFGEITGDKPFIQTSFKNFLLLEVTPK
jgi:alpha-galactosidase